MPHARRYIFITLTVVSLPLMLAAVAISGCSKGDDGYAHDVAFLSKKHFVVANWYGGVTFTRDGGESWSHADTFTISQLSVGLNGQLWGISASRGIHEPDFAALLYSTNGGDSWTTVELDPAAVMPTDFMNASGQRPLLLTRTGEIWALAGTDLSSWQSWQRLGVSNPDGVAGCGLAAGDALYVASKNRVWLSEDEGQTWSGFDLSGIVDMTHDANDCWAIDGDGVLYRTPRGKNQWNRVETKDHGWITHGAMVDSAGKTALLPGLVGNHPYSARLDPDGVAWFVDDGLYRETNGKWVRIHRPAMGLGWWIYILIAVLFLIAVIGLITLIRKGKRKTTSPTME